MEKSYRSWTVGGQKSLWTLSNVYLICLLEGRWNDVAQTWTSLQSLLCVAAESAQSVAPGEDVQERYQGQAQQGGVG